MSGPVRWSWIALAVMLIAVLLLGRCAWNGRQAAVQARHDKTLAEARTTSAVEAITEIGALGDRAAATHSQVKEAQDAVRQADPEYRDRVFRHRICVLQQRAGCDGLFAVGPADPDAGDAAR